MEEKESELEHNEEQEAAILDEEKSPLLGKEIKKYPFPKSVFFIFLNEFCERYAFYGLEAILALFLRNVLLYSETASTVIYHIFVTLSYATPVFGGILADSVIGKYTTTVYFSIIHSIGNFGIAISALPFLSLSTGTLLTVISLFITAVGIGGIKPSVAALGADQFILPDQNEQITTFFSVYYFSINLGATLSEIFTPLIRKDVHCFHQDTCYSLAFVVPAVLMVFSLVAFVIGKRMYKIKPITKSVTLDTVRCISYAIGNRGKEGKKMDHWLDYANDKYSESFIKDIRVLFRIILLFSPLVVFWALWSQMGTTWTFQATRMNGYVTESFSIKPDQLQVTNSLLILFFIPIFDYIIYPLCAKCNVLVKPLHRITFGSVLIILSFINAGILELFLMKSYPVIPSASQTNINLINSLPCEVVINISSEGSERLSNSYDMLITNGTQIAAPYDLVSFKLLSAEVEDYNINVLPLNECIVNGSKITNNITLNFLPQQGQVKTFLIKTIEKGASLEGTIVPSQIAEDLQKSNEGNAKVRILSDLTLLDGYDVNLSSQYYNYSFMFKNNVFENRPTEVDPGGYDITLQIKNSNSTLEIGSVYLDIGGSYLITIFNLGDQEGPKLRNYILTEPNKIHLAYQIPQYVLITIAEVFFAITGYQFAYEQAPESMKSTLQSIWLLTSAGGNLIIVFFVAFDIFATMAASFFFFAGLMAVATIIFMILAYRYKPHEPIVNQDSFIISGSAKTSRRTSFNSSTSSEPLLKKRKISKYYSNIK